MMPAANERYGEQEGIFHGLVSHHDCNKVQSDRQVTSQTCHSGAKEAGERAGGGGGGMDRENG